MDNEPSTDLPPPKRPWSIWQWLLLLTPSLLMIVGAVGGQGPYADGGIVHVFITAPVAIIMCILLSIKLTSYFDTDSLFFTLLICFFSFTGLVAVNFAVASAGCSVIVKGF